MDAPDELARGEQTASGMDFLAGGGELGARMRALDWSKTSLGTPARWPLSLKTTLRIVLTARQPMFVWWGDELVNLYNDAYKAILGDKHPAALGQAAAVVWREIWEQIGPRAASAMRENEGTFDEAMLLIMERHGYQEETYFTFSYSPVPNDQGGTGGIFCANTDDTRRIIGERQLALLRELASTTADARTFEQACALSAVSLATDPHDLPFAMIYLVDAAKRRAVLAGMSGIEPGHAAVPEVVDLDADPGWPFDEVIRTQTACVVPELAARFGRLPAGAWPRPPERAVVAPIAPSGHAGQAGLLVAGLSPFRLFDDGYRGFIELVAAQIAASFGNARAYEEERSRAEALAELDRAKTAFFSNVSHEFRTPLTLMLGPLADLLAEPADRMARRQRETLTVVHRNGLRLSKLVNTLLDFSRIEAGRVQAVYEPVDLSAFTAELASAFRAGIEKAGMRLVIDCPPLAEPVFVDRDMWEKIVLNLVSNAFKYTFEGEICVSLRAEQGAAVLAIRDTGTGIPAAELPSIWNRFHRVEGARGRTQEGSGIGLALVHELAKLHGGTVAVASRFGEGSVFTVSIPLGKGHLAADRIGGTRTLARTTLGAGPFVEEALRWLPDAGAGEEDPGFVATGEAPLSAIRGPRATVVLADDNADMRGYLRRLLAPHHEVIAVADGEEALRAVRERRPDLVLTDVMMPKLDGFELLRALRADPGTAATPLIMLSARAGEEARLEGLRAGADDYLTKPFSARELLARVGGTLELARTRREAVRREAELKAETIGVLESISDGFLALDAGFQTTYVNARSERLFGRPRADLVGRAIWDLWPSAAGAEVGAELRRAMTARVATRLESFHEPWGRWFEVSSYPVQRGGLGVYLRDITDEKRALEILTEADHRKDEFLAMLSHELRNPLAPIRNSLFILERAAPGGEQALRARAIIGRQIDHMTRLVEDVLDVTRIARGKIRLQRERIELSELVRRTVEDHRPLLTSFGVALSLDAGDRALWVDADGTRLVQVVGNLLQNAIKFAGRGGRVRVEVTPDDPAGQVIIRVSDTGVGISPELLPRLFQPFMQAPTTLDRSRGGLGLGLSLVKGLVELHGGHVGARSDGPGLGAEFTVRLPLVTPAAQPGAPAPPASRAPPGPPRRRVLVIEDNLDAAESLREVLELDAHEVAVAHDGPEGVAMARELRPEIILCDIGLPGLDGYAVARALRSDVALRGTLLVALSGYAQPEDRQRSQEAGFDHHLAKPPDLDELAALLGGKSPPATPRSAA
jgi:PAS domain S-box-containing protein